MRRGALAALMVLPTAAFADGPFHGFFEPRGGGYYSPLHFWAPAAYRVSFKHGTFASTLAGVGLTNSDSNGKVVVAFTFIFNQTVYQKTQTMSYAAKKRRTGAAK